MKVSVVDRHFGNESANLGIKQQLSLRLFGRAKLREAMKHSWSGKLWFYVVKCKLHGYYIDYAHGYREYFMCPECEKLSSV